MVKAPPATDTRGLWLEISNLRFITSDAGASTLEVQIRSEKPDSIEAGWRPVETNIDGADFFKTVTEALDKKRLVLARVAANNSRIVINGLRVDYTS